MKSPTLTSLSPDAGSRKKRIRLARGLGSGKGWTSGRGNKWQNARSGAKRYPTFEWGQTPLFRRIPKKRGFTARNPKIYTILNLTDLAKLAESGTTTFDENFFVEQGIAKKDASIKILWDGTLDVALTISVHAFSASAKEKIEKAGGTITAL